MSKKVYIDSYSERVFTLQGQQTFYGKRIELPEDLVTKVNTVIDVREEINSLLEAVAKQLCEEELLPLRLEAAIRRLKASIATAERKARGTGKTKEKAND